MDMHTDSDLSINDRVFVIPIDERDEPDYEEETDCRPPPYDLVCPPPSYTEVQICLFIGLSARLSVFILSTYIPAFLQCGMKIYAPSGQEILNTEINASHGSVEIPPPPYSPPLDLMSQTPRQPSGS